MKHRTPPIVIRSTAMKTLVVYSSLSGNTKKVAEAISQVLPDCDLIPVEDAPSDLSKYGLTAVGWWAAKGAPDAKTRAWLKGIHDSRLAFFGTLGALPASDHAKDCMANIESLAMEPARGNTVLGSWMCQGRIDPKVVEVMRKLALPIHQDLLKHPERFEEASRHPDESDCLAAQDFFRGILADMGHSPQPYA